MEVRGLGWRWSSWCLLSGGIGYLGAREGEELRTPYRVGGGLSLGACSQGALGVCPLLQGNSLRGGMGVCTMAGGAVPVGRQTPEHGCRRKKGSGGRKEGRELRDI